MNLVVKFSMQIILFSPVFLFQITFKPCEQTTTTAILKQRTTNKTLANQANNFTRNKQGKKKTCKVIE